MSGTDNKVTRYSTGKATGNLMRWGGIALAIVLVVVGCGVISGLVTLSSVPQSVVATSKPPATYTPYPTYTPVPAATVTAVPNQAVVGGVVRSMSEIPTYAVAEASTQTNVCTGKDAGWTLGIDQKIDQVIEGANWHSECWNVQGTLYLVSWNMADAGIGGGFIAPTPLPSPTAQTELTAPQAVTGTFALGWNTYWEQSPWRGDAQTKLVQILPEDTYPVFGEPGGLVEDPDKAFKKMSDEVTIINAPEGGYNVMNIGSVTVEYNGASLTLPPQDDAIYQIYTRGVLADGTDLDLNKAVTYSNYPRGMGSYALYKTTAYVSTNETVAMIKNSGISPNCGDSGCRIVYIVVIDLETMTYRIWATTPANPTIWTRAS